MMHTIARPEFGRAGWPQEDLRPQFELTLAQALRSIWRRKGLIALLVTVSVALALALTTQLPRRYSSEALILLTFNALEGQSSPGVEAAALVRSEADIVRSKAVARRVAEALSAADTADALPGLPGLEAGATEVERDRAILALQRNLTLSNDDESYVIHVTYTDTDPQRAALIANLFASEYLESRVERSYEEARRTTDWLDGQIALAREAADAADAKVAEFRRQNGALAESGETAAHQQLGNAIDQLSLARVDTIRAQNKLERLQASVSGGAMPSADDLAGSSVATGLIGAELVARQEVDRLRATLGQNHPTLSRAQSNLADVRAQLAGAVQAAVTLAEAELASAKAAERTLEEEVAALQAQVSDSETDTRTFRRLESEAAAAQTRLETLAEEYRRANALVELTPINASLVSEAEPTLIPVSPSKKVFAALGAVAGLLLSAALLLWLELRDRGFASGREVEDRLGLLCAGALPAHRAKGPAGPLYERAVQAAAVRLRALLEPGTGPKVLVFTSALPGEGSAALMRALSAALASETRRVLLVEAGPSEAAEAAAPQAGRRAAAGGKSRGEKPRAAEGTVASTTLASRSIAGAFESPERLGAWLDAHAGGFDAVMVEAPPVLVDARAERMVRQADLIVFAIAWRQTAIGSVRAAIRQLGLAASGRRIATVLTEIDVKAHRRLGEKDSLFYLQRYADAERRG